MTEGKVKKIITGGLEIIKGSAEELGRTVGPGALIEAALHPGGVKKSNEFSEYLQKSGPNLTPEELQQMTLEDSQKKEKEIAEARKKLKQVAPVHMRLPPEPQELRPYEKTVKEGEEKQAMEKEAQSQQSQQVVTPVGKPQSGSLFSRRKRVSKGFEGLQKDTKVG